MSAAAGEGRISGENSGPAAQRIAVVTRGVAELARTRRFYGEGFGWAPVSESDKIAFYQMNGLELGTWLAEALARYTGRAAAGPGAMALAHNVGAEAEVAPLMARLARHGGTVLREADAPPHGGRRGYLADPDGHAREIAWSPARPIDDEGRVTCLM